MINNSSEFTVLFQLKQFLLYIFWYLPGYLLCLILFRLLNKTVIYGKRPPISFKGILLVSNHQSALDSWFVGHLLFPRPVWFPAKSELFENPVISMVIKGWRAFPVKRGEHDYHAMDFMVKLLNKYIVLIHPEGTRNLSRQLKPGKIGVGKIIHEAKCVVIPVYFQGMSRLLPKGRLFPNVFLRLPIIFGEPIDFENIFSRKISKETSIIVIDKVMSEIAILQKKFIALEN